MAAPVNLKERIAALQQRSVSPNTHQSAQAVPRGLPSPGSGGLRDKIAKFESKGGMPVPRGSFAMGAPQLAENAPPRKRGELYGNRIPALGRPVHPPTSPDDSVPGPRKRCISTGTGLSASTASSFSTEVPVPPLPNGLGVRRNSLAVSFGPGRRDAESAVPEKPPEETKDTVEPSSEDTKEAVETLEQPPEESFAEEQLLQDTPTEEESPEEPAEESPKEIAEELPKELAEEPPSEPAKEPPKEPAEEPPREIAEEPSKEPAGEPPKNTSPVSLESAVSDCDSMLQPAVSQPISSPPSLPPAELPVALTPPVVSPPTSPPKQVTRPAPISVPNPTIPIPASIPTPTPTTQSPPSKSTFKAVVHRKVTEQPTVPAPSSLAPPTPQMTKHRRSINTSAIEVPPSPGGGGDLTVLLEDAALLEWRLTEGDGLKAKEFVPNTPTPTSSTFQPDPRHQSASTLTEHAHVPSVDSGSQSERSLSVPSIREPLIDGEIPEGEETDGRSLASTTFSQRSPHRKYLSNIYRLTSRRSSSYMPGSYPRDSMSVSSEDSSPVTTPSDNGKRKGFGIGWPSASPKKGGPIVSRSSSFADKIFSRNRTKSNVSSLDQERSSLYGSSQASLAIQPGLTISFPSELSPDAPPDGVDVARQTSWISPGDTNSEFSPASSILDKDIFDAFPSVPQTLPPGFHLSAEEADKKRASTLPHTRKQAHPRLSMV